MSNPELPNRGLDSLVPVSEDNRLDEDVEWTDLLFEDDASEAIHDESQAQQQWLRQKREGNEQNVFLDRIMSMVGHEQVKTHFLDVKARMEGARRWGEDVKGLDFDLVLHGKDGTGKRRIAQLYAEFLYSIGVVPRRRFKRITDGTIPSTDDGSTVIFFQNADQTHVPNGSHDESDPFPALAKLFRPKPPPSRTEIDVGEILKLVQQKKDGAVIILSHRGLSETLQSALKAIAESRGRLQNSITLQDYNEDEILELLKRAVKSPLMFEDDQDDIAKRALARKTLRAQSLKDDGFDNVHGLKIAWDQVCQRRARRLEKERSEWSKTHWPAKDSDLAAQKPVEGGITRHDIFGPEPIDLRSESEAWKEIQKLVGLEAVKKDIDSLFNLPKENYQREIQGKKPLVVNLNRVFLGDPGVGKTTVSVLYAQVVSRLGLVSNGQIIKKNPSDLIGQYTGHSENNTRKAIEDAKGNILIIDDAHMLYPRSENDYRHEILNTLVANISGSPGEDQCVILSGYADEMEKLFLDSNPGLQRRFPLEDTIKLSAYNNSQLFKILQDKMAADNTLISDHGLKAAYELLSKMRVKPKFGNGSAVENFLVRATRRQSDRLKADGVDRFNICRLPLEARDFDPDFDRSLRADTNRDELFEGYVGFEDIISQFRGYQKMADGMQRVGRDPRPYIPWAFVFKGPPGTGKTSTARKVGGLFLDMGFNSSDEVITCSATDLIGKYLGQTGPKVISQFEKGLGKVLFIDEAYRLNPGSGKGDSYVREAIDEIVDIMTKPKFARNMVVILAGYDKEMEDLMQSNPGLRSRFPTHIVFPHMEPEACLQHLTRQLLKLDISISEGQRQIIHFKFKQLITTKGWANGRDVETLAESIIRSVFIKVAEIEQGSEPGQLEVTPEQVIETLQEMLRERRGPSKTPGSQSHDNELGV
ncbi:P-loop containing nucleoside triphosphate hydrolase protein [Nemania sp. NC0429]|nr:P-loop containing nucleoside triphosphate hydrolase protein [Nemania sp. NC0429]